MLNNILVILFILYIILSGFALNKFIKNSKKKYRNIKIIFIVSLLLLIIYLYYYLYKDSCNQKGGYVNFRRYGQKHPEKIPKLLNECGLPQNYSVTSHCFADSTHQTCCMLGPEARRYADNSGNPIGEASVLAFREKYGRYPKKNELTGWCTCFGSKVCSEYAKKFNDGTHIKFVNNPKNKTKIRSKVHSDCEGYFRDKFSIRKHGTPGINNNFSSLNSHKGKICEELTHSKLKYI